MTDPIESVESGSDTLRVYEVGYLLLPSIPEEKVPDEVSHIIQFITDAKGTIITKGDPELQPIAYEMEKHIATRNERFNDAYFGFIVFEGTPELAVALKTKLDATEGVLRFLLIKTEREIVPPVRKPKQVATEAEATDKSDSEGSESEEDLDSEIEELVA